ncbi:MAG: hypothetical protein Q8P57_04135 [Candidatus Pacearchaeota archaeon]|nr:hypothetical protein [Candidatus Pacearchaeota archaeon]
MADEKKSFFRERTLQEIEKLPERIPADTRVGLIHKLITLNPSEEAIEIRVPLTTQEFYAKDSAEASRKSYRHGHYQLLSHPTTQGSALSSRRNPLSYRVRDLSFLSEVPEESIQTIGYSFRPVQGRDRRKRMVPFVQLLEAARLYTYTTRRAGGFVVEAYPDSRKVSQEGAEVIVKVPSTTTKKPRYRQKLIHIPVKDNQWKRAIVWGFATDHEGSLGRPEFSTYNIRYTSERSQEESRVFFFDRGDIASYWATVSHFRSEGNNVPWEMDPFAKPSQLLAYVHTLIRNNVLIFDSTLKSKDKLRKPRMNEQSILLAQTIGVLGHDNTIFWDSKRDPKLRDFNWNIPGLREI